jgi:tetratricopeptide (TPR) repeat protein
MEIITKLKYLLWIVLLAGTTVSAQDFEPIRKAFSSSYDLENNGDYAAAIKILKEVYAEDSYEINLRLGWLNYSNGNFTESSAYYKRAIDLSPYAIEARFGYVYPLSALGNWGVVQQQYKKILEIDPNNTLANYRMGMIYYSGEDFASALKYFEKVVNLYPFDYDGTIMYAWTHFKLGKLREAELLFQKALLIRPDDESAREGLNYIR